MPSDDAGDATIHSLVVRLTHWLVAVSFIALVVSGTAILIIHPRFYWGETGTAGMAALFELPFPSIRGHSGWGRYLHFLAAWVCVLSGITYVAAGLVRRHFRNRLLPARSELRWQSITSIIRDHLSWRRPDENSAWEYNVVQRLTYLVVIFVLFPTMIWTGLAMSPTITAQYPFLATVLGGHQSARTIHFVVANLLLIFLVTHLAMLALVGARPHIAAMFTGRKPERNSAT